MDWLCLVCNTVNNPGKVAKDNNMSNESNYKSCKKCHQYNHYITNNAFDNYCNMNQIIDKLPYSEDTNIWIDYQVIVNLCVITNFTITRTRILEHVNARLYNNRFTIWTLWRRKIGNKKYVKLLEKMLENYNKIYIPIPCINLITSYLSIK